MLVAEMLMKTAKQFMIASGRVGLKSKDRRQHWLTSWRTADANIVCGRESVSHAAENAALTRWRCLIAGRLVRPPRNPATRPRRDGVEAARKKRRRRLRIVSGMLHSLPVQLNTASDTRAGFSWRQQSIHRQQLWPSGCRPLPPTAAAAAAATGNDSGCRIYRHTRQRAASLQHILASIILHVGSTIVFSDVQRISASLKCRISNKRHFSFGLS